MILRNEKIRSITKLYRSLLYLFIYSNEHSKSFAQPVVQGLCVLHFATACTTGCKVYTDLKD